MIFGLQAVILLIFALGYYKLSSNLYLRRIKSFAFGFNAVSLAFLLATFTQENLYVYSWPHKADFYLKYGAFSLLVGLIMLAIKAGWEKYKRCTEAKLINAEEISATGKMKMSPSNLKSLDDGAKSRLGRKIAAVTGWTIGTVGFLGLGALAFFVSSWTRSYFGILSPDQVLFGLIGEGGGKATADVAANISNYMVAPVAIFVGLGLQVAIWLHNKWSRIVALLTSFLLFVSAWAYAASVLPLHLMIVSQLHSSDFLAQNYVEPSEVLSFPAQKRNMIHIYMESVENSYYDRVNGGYGQENLMPELLELNKENVYFSNRTDTMGGPHQVYGAAHSVAAMVNMESGVPMKTNVGGGSRNMSYYPNFPTFGELLARHGYQNEIMLGGDATWGGMKSYYETHGNFRVFDHNYALANGYIPAGYDVWWGYEDDKLYKFAKQELTRLSKTGQPFYFILENADTHFPDGYKSPLMKKTPFKKQYANVIFYSQAEVVKFVKWCQQQDFYANTTILITGDHRSMDKNFFKGWDLQYERTVVNMYINPAPGKPEKTRMHNRQYAPFDFFPTSLAAIGCQIKGERAGLGTNLFSGQPTLIEQYGLDKVNIELSKKSSFYFDYVQPVKK